MWKYFTFQAPPWIVPCHAGFTRCWTPSVLLSLNRSSQFSWSILMFRRSLKRNRLSLSQWDALYTALWSSCPVDHTHVINTWPSRAVVWGKKVIQVEASICPSDQGLRRCNLTTCALFILYCLCFSCFLWWRPIVRHSTKTCPPCTVNELVQLWRSLT